jgi:competence transcription factor ComK
LENEFLNKKGRKKRDFIYIYTRENIFYQKSRTDVEEMLYEYVLEKNEWNFMYFLTSAHI